MVLIWRHTSLCKFVWKQVRCINIKRKIIRILFLAIHCFNFFLNLGIRFSFFYKVLWDTHNNKNNKCCCDWKIGLWTCTSNKLCVCMCDALCYAMSVIVKYQIYLHTLSIFNFTAVVVLLLLKIIIIFFFSVFRMILCFFFLFQVQERFHWMR